MKSPADLKKLKLALRDQLCGECLEKQPQPQPTGAPPEPLLEKAQEATPPAAAPCESDCSLFVNLPRLARIAKEGEPPCGYSVYEKSLENCQGQIRKTDIAQAMSILESAGAESKSDEQKKKGPAEQSANEA